MGAQHRLTGDEARALLARGQRLTGPERGDGASVAAAVSAVVAIQAQELGAASLGVRARLAGVTAGEVTRAREEERSVARIWCMRATLHLVAAEDAGWLIALLGPVALAKHRRRHAELGVDADDAARIVQGVVAERGPSTRHEIAAAARERGLAMADDPQAPVHLVMRAVLHGYVCEAAPRGGKPTYALWEDWLGHVDAPAAHGDRDALLAELARRHAAAHPPTGLEDLARWSGLGMSEARRGYEAIAGELEPVHAAGRDVWVPRALPPTPSDPPGVRLLPNWDGLLLGHRDRALTLAPEVPPTALVNGGVLRATLLVDGRVEGTWRLERGKPDVTPFGPLSARARKAAEEEAADIVRHRAS